MRYSRNRNRFVTVPPELDCNSSNHALLNAALAAGLYPKILVVDPINGQMRTILNNQQVSFHPTSVNFGKKASDMGSQQLAYFTLMYVFYGSYSHAYNTFKALEEAIRLGDGTR